MAQLKSWVKAARLRTLPLSLSGIIAGSSIAASKNAFDPLLFFLALLTTTGFQVISNFANDYGDGVKGTDNRDRVGPSRAIQSGEISPSEMKNGIKKTTIATFIIALILIYVSFGIEHIVYAILFIILGVSSIIAAVKYTVGKSAYGYSGLGDLFVFLFFGLLSVCGSYFLYTKSMDYAVLLPAFSIGFLSAGVLNLNNMRDRESDEKSGKITLVVKIGEEFAKYYHYYLIGASLLFAVMYTALRYHSVYQFIFLFAYFPIFSHLLRIYKTQDLRLVDPELKKLALATFLFSVLFGIGVII